MNRFVLTVSEGICVQRYFKVLLVGSVFLILLSCGSSSKSKKLEVDTQNIELVNESMVKAENEAIASDTSEYYAVNPLANDKDSSNSATNGSISLILKDTITVHEIPSDILMAKTYGNRLFVLDWNAKIYIYDIYEKTIVKKIDLYSYAKHSFIYPYNFIVSESHIEILDLSKSSIYFMNLSNYEIESYVKLNIEENKTIDPLFTGFGKFNDQWILSLFNRDPQKRYKNEHALSFFNQDGDKMYDAIPYPKELSLNNHVPHLGAIKSFYQNQKIYTVFNQSKNILSLDENLKIKKIKSFDFPNHDFQVLYTKSLSEVTNEKELFDEPKSDTHSKLIMIDKLFVLEHIKYLNNDALKNEAVRYLNFIDEKRGFLGQKKINNMKLLLAHDNQLWFKESETDEDLLKLKIYDIKNNEEI